MRALASVLVLAIVAVTIELAPARAQEPGNFITFAVPEGTEISILGSEDPGDKIIFVGRPGDTTAGGTCAFGESFPVQSVVIVDARPTGRTPRRAQVTILSQDTPVSPGTRLTDIFIAPQCDIDNVIYDRYIGRVE